MTTVNITSGTDTINVTVGTDTINITTAGTFNSTYVNSGVKFSLNGEDGNTYLIFNGGS